MAAKALFKWGALSERQKKVLTWWTESSKYKDYDGIIADGSIRSGKTVSMGFSFVLWAMSTFNGENFAMCGKTVGSFRRNVWRKLKQQLHARGYVCQERRAENLIIIFKGGTENFFYIFGGKDESSQDLIQGLTLAGVLFDEVALMPESFVNQATGRCSVEGSKYWFNCNPAGSQHWFYKNWVLKARKKKLVYLHFTMEDNLTLSAKVKARYASMYSGLFFKRYILGLWVVAEGIIYSMFNSEKHVLKDEPITEGPYYVSTDYGMKNANVFQLWRKEKGADRYICMGELRHSGRESQIDKTISELVDDFEEWLDGIMPEKIIVDPSATALINELRKRGYTVKKARNDVVPGISDVQICLQKGYIAFMSVCKYLLDEILSYSWDQKKSDAGIDAPIKLDDHSMDALRYFVYTMRIIREFED